MWHWVKTEKFVGITQVISLAVKTKPTCVARTAQQKCKLKALFRNLLCNFVKIKTDMTYVRLVILFLNVIVRTAYATYNFFVLLNL